jgi:hypothetical protein
MKRKLKTWEQLKKDFPDIKYTSRCFYEHPDWEVGMPFYFFTAYLGKEVNVYMKGSHIYTDDHEIYDEKWFVQRPGATKYYVETEEKSTETKSNSCNHEWVETPGFLPKTVYKDCKKCGKTWEEHLKEKPEITKEVTLWDANTEWWK